MRGTILTSVGSRIDIDREVSMLENDMPPALPDQV
jgi:hypothetical protein